MTPDLSAIDWTALMKSPLVMFLPVTFGVALFVWLVTEASSFFVPAKFRPAVAMALGPFLGWACVRLEVLDFGAGPLAWGRGLLFGLMAGSIAVVFHPLIKNRWPFSLLTTRTPSTHVPPAPPTPGGGTP